MIKLGKEQCTKILLAIFIIGSITLVGCSNQNEVVLSGEGTETSPYLISSVEELECMVNNINNNNERFKTAHYKMTKDIDLKGVDWLPIGHFTDNFEWESIVFDGTFDGDNHKVKNLKIDINKKKDQIRKPYSYGQGLFAIIGSNAIIKNLMVENIEVNYKNSNQDNIRIGGIVGINDGGKIMNCKTSVKLNVFELEKALGGIAGVNYGSIEECSAEGFIDCCYEDPFMGDAYVGGVAAFNFGTVKTSYSSIKIHSHGQDSMRFIGGFVGNNQGKISQSSSEVELKLTGGNGSIGGFAGFNQGVIEECNVNGKLDVEGPIIDVGGFVGVNSIIEMNQVNQGIINNCKANCSISVLKKRPIDMIGAFAGENEGQILKSTCSSINVDLDFIRDNRGISD